MFHYVIIFLLFLWRPLSGGGPWATAQFAPPPLISALLFTLLTMAHRLLLLVVVLVLLVGRVRASASDVSAQRQRSHVHRGHELRRRKAEHHLLHSHRQASQS